METVLWSIKWHVAVFLLFTAITYSDATVQEVQEKSEVVIQCPLSGNNQYPTWTGPDGLARPLTQDQTINEPGIEWVNNKDLKIASAMLKHDGNYTCKNATNSTATVELDVQYFHSTWAEFTTATPENTRTVLTCTVHSNPRSKIVPHIITHVRPGDDPEKTNSTTTFHPCEMDPSSENRTKCTVTAVMHVSKEDNGLEMSCAFEYKNSTRVTMYPKVRFLFPPTIVNITGNRQITDSDQSKLKLTCSTDSSNPVSSLVWRKGTSEVANENRVISSSYQSVAMDAEYHGQNITQDIDIEINENTDNEKVFCCASHSIETHCDSITLDYLVASITYSAATVQEVQEKSEVVIQCPLSGSNQYPTWTGPDGLASPLTQDQTINEPGIEWVNNTDLKIASAMLKHDGNYTCKDATNSTATVELDVQYFHSTWAEFTTATPENTRTVLTCTVRSNPRSKIVPHIITHVRPGDDPEKKNSTTTFHPCEMDPSSENRTKCTVTAVMHVSKEDNGLEMSCAFEYKNSTRVTMYPKVRFLFPPTIVNITGNRQITDSDQSKLKLTCSTDSSNPVSSLVWRKGTSEVANENSVISSSYQSVAMDAEYHGQNITQDIDIEINENTDNEKVFCCASHSIETHCDSITLDYLVASAGSVVARWMTTLFIICAVSWVM